MLQKLREAKHNFVCMLQRNPPVYDFYVEKIKRGIAGARTEEYDLLTKVHKALPRPVRFLQIGANDGMRNDPIREFVVRRDWHGTLVEPIPWVFKKLKENYAYCSRGQISFQNVAVSDSGGELVMYTLSSDYLDSLPLEAAMNLSRRCSIYRRYMESVTQRVSHEFPDAPNQIVEIHVPCRTALDIITEGGKPPELDILVMDAEGHDFTILQSIDFTKLSVKAIFFEVVKGKEEEIREFITSKDFRLHTSGRDGLALHNSFQVSGL